MDNLVDLVALRRRLVLVLSRPRLVVDAAQRDLPSLDPKKKADLNRSKQGKEARGEKNKIKTSVGRCSLFFSGKVELQSSRWQRGLPGRY